MNDTGFVRTPFLGDACFLECMHKKETKRHKRAVKNMRSGFAACMEKEDNAPVEAQVQFVICVARVAPQALVKKVVRQWMRREDVARLLGDEGITFLMNELGVKQ